MPRAQTAASPRSGLSWTLRQGKANSLKPANTTQSELGLLCNNAHQWWY